MEQEDGNLITNEFLLQYPKEESERLFGQRINTCHIQTKSTQILFNLTEIYFQNHIHMQFTKQ